MTNPHVDCESPLTIKYGAGDIARPNTNTADANTNTRTRTNASKCSRNTAGTRASKVEA